MKPGPHLPSGRNVATTPGRKVKPRCPTCDIRLVVGEPSPDARWEGMSLTQEQVNKLLLAAAEFDDVAEQYNDRPSAVEFVDWLGPDAQAGIKEPVPYIDGKGSEEWPPYVELAARRTA